MNHGKNICNQLKEVRKRIAEENDIPLKIDECTYKGECSGTCPRCEAELRYLENTLADRLRLGMVATVAGFTLGLSATVQAQSPATPTTTRDSIAKINHLPPIQCTDTDVDAYKLPEENSRVIRGESGAVVKSGIVRRRKMPPPNEPVKDTTLHIKFIDENGTPARQSISTEPPKMYEENEEGVKIIVR